MALFVISYREAWEKNCEQGCNCILDSIGSDYEFRVVDNEDQASAYIAHRISEAPEAKFMHLILPPFCGEQSHEFFKAYFATRLGSDSVKAPYGNTHSQNVLKVKVNNELRRIADLQRKVDEEKKRLDKLTQEERTKEREWKEYQRLKAKFETTTNFISV